MINCIFWDLDETLIHTHNADYIKHDFIISLDGGGWGVETYKVKVHPDSKELLAHSRKLVGYDNVFILTSSTNEYANLINTKAGFGFSSSNIIAREGIRDLLARKDTRYQHPDNILIDNLRWVYNGDKMEVIGIDEYNYLEVHDYYGVDYSDNPFKRYVMTFLNEKV